MHLKENISKIIKKRKKLFICINDFFKMNHYKKHMQKKIYTDFIYCKFYIFISGGSNAQFRH